MEKFSSYFVHLLWWRHATTFALLGLFAATQMIGSFTNSICYCFYVSNADLYGRRYVWLV